MTEPARENMSWTTAHGDVVEVFRADDDQFHWHVQAGNGEIVGGGEGHPNRQDAIIAAERHHPPVASGA